MKTTKKEFNKRLIFLVCSAIYFGLVLILTSFISNAASDQDYFPMEQNKNGKIPENIINYLDNNFTETYYTFCYFEKREVNDFSPGHYYYYYRVVLYPKASGDNIYGEINNDLIHFSLYALNNNGVLFRRLSYYDTTPNNITVANNGSFAQFQNLLSSNYDSSKDYVSNFRVYTNNNPDTRKVVLLYGSVDPEINDNDTYPEELGKPSLNDYYDISEAPSFDNSTTTSAIESLFDILQWYFSNGIVGIFNYLVDNINWALQKVINNIREVLQNVSTELQEVVSDFSDTVSGFLSDIQDKISDFYDGFMEFADLFINPFDAEEFDEQIEGCQLISQYEDLLDNCDIIREVFVTAQEKDSFILYIDFENPLADSEHKIIASEINFNWLVPLRSVYRPFLWVFTLLECFIGGCRLLGNIIGGKAK